MAQRKPRFNHVAMSVPAELLDATGRKELLDFYSEVLGFGEMPGLSIDRERLVLRAHGNEQFVFLQADPEPMRCPAMDHFGMSVGTHEEFEEILEHARRYRQRDDRVEIIEPRTEEYGLLKLHGFYLRYRLPMMIEVQHFEWTKDASARGEAGGQRTR